jgi:hypothetical protein
VRRAGQSEAERLRCSLQEQVAPSEIGQLFAAAAIETERMEYAAID